MWNVSSLVKNYLPTPCWLCCKAARSGKTMWAPPSGLPDSSAMSFPVMVFTFPLWPRSFLESVADQELVHIRLLWASVPGKPFPGCRVSRGGVGSIQTINCGAAFEQQVRGGEGKTLRHLPPDVYFLSSRKRWGSSQSTGPASPYLVPHFHRDSAGSKV